ncbi:stage II sporulation protein R [Ruminococcus bromii]|uniref:stage II sporulation protein R n=1 Tax=Ruminococcus bromii TaxID=40518 RepID=UPI0029303C24|nr:stage II sporulation protein R [Ruminococcus bromii]MDE8727834.1 stage II sporulation protein R [Ruminococcus bromii]
MKNKIKALCSRTLLLRAMACGLILTVLLNLTGFSAQCAALEENIVRLHVIANSNTEEDQNVKLRVRDAVLSEAKKWYGNAEDFDDAVTALCTHLESLEAAANSVLEAESFPYRAKAEICEMYFPTRTYESFKLPAGHYRTLRISLGKAEGKNWWCVVFPALCVPGASDLSDLPSDTDTLVREPEGYEVKFKVAEIFSRLRELFDA